MDAILAWIQSHANYAHYTLFLLALLAGMNIPISIDLLMIAGATLAATAIPEHFYHLFFSLFIGCATSAWIAYGLGRFLGRKLLTLSFFSKFLSQRHLDSIGHFYAKRGPLAFIIGRFIPFGIRNALYMSSGISRLSFPKFALWDGLACLIWSLFSFSLYYALGKNIHTLHSGLKWVNLAIFSAFSVTVIAIIWYKRGKKAKEENV